MNGNGSMTIIDDEDSIMGRMVVPEAAVNSAIQLAGVLIDKRVATARNYPRSMAKFKANASTLIREDVEVARAAEYAKPIGGGVARGPSIRLLEIAALCWGNLDDGMVEAIVEDKSVRVTWYAYDLERNNRSEGYSSCSILDKYGHRYKQHLIETTVLATASKARRNALEKVIPKAFLKDLLKVAKEVADGQREPLDVTRRKTLDFFARSYKVQPDQIFARLGITGEDDITEEHIDDLRAIATSLKDAESKVDEWFETPAATKTDELRKKLGERQKPVTPAKQPEPERNPGPETVDPVTPQAKPEAAKAPSPPAGDMLMPLIEEYERKGGEGIIAKFCEAEGIAYEELIDTKKLTRAKFCDKLNKAIEALKGESKS